MLLKKVFCFKRNDVAQWTNLNWSDDLKYVCSSGHGFLGPDDHDTLLYITSGAQSES